jgi:hypothetical protein
MRRPGTVFSAAVRGVPRRRAWFLLAVATAATLVLAGGGVARAGSPKLHFRVFADTGLNLTDIVWTGAQFLYVDNTTNTVSAAPPAGVPLQPFAAMPREVEETRCVLSPGEHGFPANAIFCHSPDNKIYEISPDGAQVSVFATLPTAATPPADGALAFDTVGDFGYSLVAATGRSGAPTPSGGTVFTIDASGGVKTIGGYKGPGGADELAIAPASFGSLGGQALLTVDPGPTGGRLVAMDAEGRTRTVAKLSDGPNPIAFVSRSGAGAVAAGLYVTDTLSHDVFFAPGAPLSGYVGDAIVGSELKGMWWVIRPLAKGFQVIPVQTNLHAKQYNLEGAIYVG